MSDSITTIKNIIPLFILAYKVLFSRVLKRHQIFLQIKDIV